LDAHHARAHPIPEGKCLAGVKRPWLEGKALLGLKAMLSGKGPALRKGENPQAVVQKMRFAQAWLCSPGGRLLERRVSTGPWWSQGFTVSAGKQRQASQWPGQWQQRERQAEFRTRGALQWQLDVGNAYHPRMGPRGARSLSDQIPRPRARFDLVCFPSTTSRNCLTGLSLRCCPVPIRSWGWLRGYSRRGGWG